MAYASAILTKRDEEVGSLGLWSGWWDLERVKYCLLGEGEGGLVGVALFWWLWWKGIAHGRDKGRSTS